MRTTTRERFAEVVRAQPIDLGLACMLIGAESDPDLDIAAQLVDLDLLAAMVPSSGRPIERLQTVLGDFRGSEIDYADLRSSLLHEVLRRRRGLPILLSVIWLEVARRSAIPAFGIALPGHFIVGVGDPDDEHEYADPWGGGRIWTQHEIADRHRRAVGLPPTAEVLAPVDDVALLHRVLANIRTWADRPDRSVTKRWSLELSLLLPSHALDLRREHASVLIETGAFDRGADELDRYADAVAVIDLTAAENARRDARLARARLN
jgi:hypothetical protein